MILTGIILFLAIIPLHFVKQIFRQPAAHSNPAIGAPAAIVFMVVSFTSLVCLYAGPVLFCLGLLQLLMG